MPGMKVTLDGNMKPDTGAMSGRLEEEEIWTKCTQGINIFSGADEFLLQSQIRVLSFEI